MWMPGSHLPLKRYSVTEKGIECPGTGSPEGRRSKDDAGVSSLPYAFLKLGYVTTRCEPGAAAWAPMVMCCGRDVHDDGFKRVQPWGAMGFTTGFSVE